MDKPLKAEAELTVKVELVVKFEGDGSVTQQELDEALSNPDTRDSLAKDITKAVTLNLMRLDASLWLDDNRQASATDLLSADRIR